MSPRRTTAHVDAEQRMRELIERAGLPEPDEVSYDFEPDEVPLVWWRPKLAVVIELDGREEQFGGVTPVLH
jgi:hypothetical protein